MPKKYNDYYDHDNKVQLKPQTWECPKCAHQVQVLSAKDVSHKCPQNKKKATFYKKVSKTVTKKVAKKVTKKVAQPSEKEVK